MLCLKKLYVQNATTEITPNRATFLCATRSPPTPKPMHIQMKIAFDNSSVQSISSHRLSSSSSTSMRLMRFLVNSNAVKKMALTTQERDMDTPNPDHYKVSSGRDREKEV